VPATPGLCLAAPLQSFSDMARLALLVPALTWLLSAACGPVSEVDDEDEASSDLSRVPQRVRVNGTVYDVETEYLPRVVQCENPQAPLESMKAQAIAARTYLTYRSRGVSLPIIADGQNEQVMTCSSNKNGTYVPDAVKQAVEATRGKVLMYRGKIVAGQFVAGALRNSSCARTTDPTNTERYVTINVGLSGNAIRRAPRPFANPDAPENRGAMGQNLANCLATRSGMSAGQLLAYFYGEDIEIKGEGTAPTPPKPQENDPAVTPPVPDPMTPTDPMMPPSDPNVPLPGKCWSFTMQRWADTGECVQSVTDRIWYQCVDQQGWMSPVHLDTGMGPGGACTKLTAL
jgi:hypothetical protein